MPYKLAADKKAREQKRTAAKRAARIISPESSGEHRRKPFNPGPWKTPEPRPWVKKGVAP